MFKVDSGLFEKCPEKKHSEKRKMLIKRNILISQQVNVGVFRGCIMIEAFLVRGASLKYEFWHTSANVAGSGVV